MKKFNSNTENKDEWLTSPYIIEALGKFDLDPCSPINRPWDTATTHYNINDNGLNLCWQANSCLICVYDRTGYCDGYRKQDVSRVWLNPPYGRETFKWVAKLAEHGNGIALIYARTDTKGFQEHVLNKADAIFFFKGRLNFYNVDGTQAKNNGGAPSCLVAYGNNNVEAIEKSGLKGKLIFID